MRYATGGVLTEKLRDEMCSVETGVRYFPAKIS